MLVFRTLRNMFGALGAACLLAGVARAAEAAGLTGDETGMVPGDIVLGNMNTFPGHAGIYIGKWKRLPQRLQDQYAGVHEAIVIRSRDEGLKDTYLVVDSDGGRGVRVTPFVEQFTGYLPKGAKAPNLTAALQWESEKGGALQWESLAVDDERRWNIVEEALKAAAARVPYPTVHTQMETTFWNSGVPYEELDSMDCTGLVHVVYYRGAGIDVDVSWMPLHTPGQLYDQSESHHLRRAVLLDPVWREAALLGVWDVSVRTVASGSDFKINADVTVAIRRPDKVVTAQALDPQTLEPAGKVSEVEEADKLQPTVDNALQLDEYGEDGAHQVLRIEAGGGLTYVSTGVDDDGPYELRATGTKRRGPRS